LDKRNEKLGWSEYDKLRPSPRREEVEDRRDKRALRDSGIRERDRRDRGGARDDENEREIERRERARERERERRRQEHRERRRQRREEERAADKATGDEDETRGLAYNESKRARDHPRDSQGRRVVSDQKLEQGPTKYYSDKEEFRDDVRPYDGSDSTNTDEDDPEKKRKLRRKIFVGIAILIVLLLIIIPVAVVVSKKKSAPGNDSSGTSSSQPGNSELDGLSESDLPKNVQGTILDPWTWYDTTSFNVTYTPETVGGLSVMGLMSTWDDSKQANANVPPLNQPFQYGTMKIRGVNLGGWLSIEPFITPSLFSSYNTHDGVVDEYTLTQTLGPMRSKSILEKHYATFVRESTFAEIQAAGFDHIRIPFSYWAVTTYDGDPYVPQVSWRYLLRAIEWARKYGLRINLDLHGAPGSQNGWNHSGRQGTIRWLNGTDGTLNGQRTIDIHKQLSTFFSQPRYKNIVTMYGLVNEPRMVSLNADTVRQWTQSAYTAVRASNFTGIIIFGDGFMGLDKWQGQLTSNQGLLLDVHQYTIFNVQQIVLNHHDKINFACGGWTAQALRSSNPSTGFGPTLCGEWSQADTDCARYLNNVGVGSRWEGTLNTASTPGGSADGSVLTPTCPTKNNPRCSCDQANADPSTYSPEYKQWLLMFAEAQMASFENGWGWFYWTWQTESAAQWSYRTGLAAGTLPQKAYARSFNCSSEIPQFASLGLPEYY
jgi:glucan 1,3-beta-glucosidase